MRSVPLIARFCTLAAASVALSSAPALAQLRVIVVPHDPNNLSIPHSAYNGHATTLKAIARGAAPSGCQYRWDLNQDGVFEAPTPARQCNPGTPGGVTCYDLGQRVLIAPQTVRKLLDFPIMVTCPGQPPAFGNYRVLVHPDVPAQSDPNDNTTASPHTATDDQLRVMRNVALDDLLWYLHTRMEGRSGSGAEIAGAFTAGPSLAQIPTAASAAWVWSINGHLPAYPPGTYSGPIPGPSWQMKNDTRWNTDPYSEDVIRALNFMLGTLHPVVLTDPDDEEDDGSSPIPGTNDALALAANATMDPDSTPAQGHALAAFAVSGLAGTAAQAGDPNHVRGRSIEHIVQQIVDWVIFAQTDDLAPSFGGWDYEPNGGMDGSTSQWAFIGLEAAEIAMSAHGVHVSDRTKMRIAALLNLNQSTTGLICRGPSCTDQGTFYPTGGSLSASGWLGFNRFDPSDANVIAQSWFGADITAGQMRQTYEQYLSGLGTFWDTFQSDATGETTGLWRDGNFMASVPGGGSGYAIYSTMKGLRSLDPAPPGVGGHDWYRELSSYLIRSQRPDGSWGDAPWGGIHPVQIWGSDLIDVLEGLALSPGLGTWSPCAGTDDDADGHCTDSLNPDCDDLSAAVYPGAPQVCDGLNNDCTHPSWPFLPGTNETDDDGDSLSECQFDCDDTDGQVWMAPTEISSLQVSHDQGMGLTGLDWTQPVAPGGSIPLYDVLRADASSDFLAGATCVETDGADLMASDADAPTTGGVFSYLVRAGNRCQEGPLGRNSEDEPIPGRQCLREDGAVCSYGGECVHGACCSAECRDLAADPAHCGACGLVCTPDHIPIPLCSGGVCVGACDAGWGDCNDDKLTDGCETDLSSSASSCGACGMACSSNHIPTPSCSGGVCVGVCDSGWADCNGNKLTDGCETPVSTSASNCGGCGMVCSSNHIGAPSCSGGVCDGACDPGWADCNGNKLTDGCETDLSSSASSCGACGQACSSNHIPAPSCSGGVCVGTCDSGWADCNGNKLTDGCETPVSTSASDCGGCGMVCSSNHIPAPTCSGGVCVGTCDAGWADCNGNKLTDGCETDLRNDAGSCGACGNVCGPGVPCTAGVCTSTCPAGPPNSLWTSPLGGGTPSAPVNDTAFNPTGGSFNYIAQGTSVHAIRNTATGGQAAGSKKWTRIFPATLQDWPIPVTLRGGSEVVFVAATNGFLYCINAVDGANCPAWASIDTRRPTCPNDQLIATPTVQLYNFSNVAFRTAHDDDLVYVVTRAMCADGDQRNRVLAVGAADGTVKWVFNPVSIGQPMNYGSEACAVDYATNRMYCGTAQPPGPVQNTLWAIDTIGGTLQWSRNAGTILNRPQLLDGRVYVATQPGQLRVYQAGAGADVYSVPVGGGNITRNPWVDFHGGMVTILMTDSLGLLHGYVETLVPVPTAAPAWPATNLGGTVTTMPAASPLLGKAWVGLSNGRIHQVSLATGQDEGYVTVGATLVYDPTLDIQGGGAEINRIVAATTNQVRRFCAPWAPGSAGTE